MVFIKRTAQEKNIHKTIPNMGFSNMGWLRQNVAEAEIPSLIVLFTQSLGQTFYFTSGVYGIKSCNLCT